MTEYLEDISAPWFVMSSRLSPVQAGPLESVRGGFVLCQEVREDGSRLWYLEAAEVCGVGSQVFVVVEKQGARDLIETGGGLGPKVTEVADVGGGIDLAGVGIA